MSCRCTLDRLLVGEHASFSRVRHFFETLLILAGSLTVALLYPNAAEKIFAVTGEVNVSVKTMLMLLKCLCHDAHAISTATSK